MKKVLITFWTIIFFIGQALFGTVSAEEKYLTKEQALKNLSSISAVKTKIDHFVSWTTGYDLNKVNRVKLVPTIKSLKAAPKRVPPDGRTVLEITATIDDPGGRANIGGVRADLTNIGRFSNMSLVDNGLFGDEKPQDGIYTLQANVDPKVSLGEKEVPVTVANRKGWLTVAKTSIDVEKNPKIIQFYSDKSRYSAGATIIITLKVENPGYLRDIKSVIVDLSDLGLGKSYPMQKIKSGWFTLELVLPRMAAAGTKNIPVIVTNLSQGQAAGEVSFEVSP